MEKSGGEEPVIGIDLGTTCSCVGAWLHDKVEIIANDLGNRTTPSFVAFTDSNERLVGEAAKNQAATNPKNTIFDAKRLIGRRYNDYDVERDVKNWPFKVIADPSGRPLIVVSDGKKEMKITAEEVSAALLSKMKQTAEALLGRTVHKAVVTVPAYFNDSQRKSTMDAGRIAGLEIVRIINEPTAAAIAYGLDLKKSGEKRLKKVLVFDLGGGTFDVSILEIKDGVIDVKATGGDTHLGGEDFDNNMVSHFVREFRRKHKKDISRDSRALRRLRTECERAKRGLSSTTVESIEIACLYDGIDFQTKITRAKFEDLNMEFFDKCLVVVDRCLKDANMEKSSIDDVVLVGGSTRIVKIQEMLQEFFDGKPLCKKLNADEAVALGAAVQATKLGSPSSSSDANPCNEIVLHDITPLSLGTPNHHGAMKLFIPRNTPVPVVREQIWTLTEDNMTSTTFPVYEGEREMARDNKLLGKLHLTGISPQPAYKSSIKVTFRVDLDGILNVSAEDLATGHQATTTITNDHGRLSAEEIHRKIEEAQRYKLEDEKRRRKADAKSELEKYVYLTRNTIRQPAIASSIPSWEKNRLEQAIASAIEWSEEDDPKASEADYCDRKAEIEKLWNKIRRAHC